MAKQLVRIDTYIEEFFKNDEGLHSEFLINEVKIEALKSIFVASQDDPELYEAYEITLIEAEKINALLDSKIPFDFDNYEYLLQRYGEYA